MKLLPTYPPGRAPLHSRYHPGFVEKIKAVPGVSWDARNKFWLVPIELSNELLSLGAKYKVEPQLRLPGIQAKSALPTFPPPEALRGSRLERYDLFPFQPRGIESALREGHYILNWETGLGKTPAAIVAVSEANQWPCLVITPSAVKSHWVRQIEKWGEGDCFVVEAGADWKEYSGQTWVVSSYELAAESINFLKPKAFVLDELHYLKNAKAKRSKSIAEILHSNLSAFQIGLTATLMSVDPSDLWHQLECLWPGRFGNFYQFRKRYAVAEVNKYATGGYNYRGLNTLFALELRGRLQTVSDRVIKDEVAHLLPAFTVESIRFKPRDPAIEAAARKAFGAKSMQKRALLDESIAVAFKEKAGVALEQLEIEVQNCTHIVVATHLRKSATALMRLCNEKFSDFAVFHIDGDVSPAERDSIITSALGEPKAILITTMHAVGIGIDNLTHFQCAIVVELYYSPIVMTQFLGRFSRLSGKTPTKVILLVFLGTHDELVADSLLQNLTYANELFASSSSEVGLTKSLSDSESEESFLDRLATAAFSGD